jgi:hypothetical protein
MAKGFGAKQGLKTLPKRSIAAFFGLSGAAGVADCRIKTDQLSAGVKPFRTDFS